MAADRALRGPGTAAPPGSWSIAASQLMAELIAAAAQPARPARSAPMLPPAAMAAAGVVRRGSLSTPVTETGGYGDPAPHTQHAAASLYPKPPQSCAPGSGELAAAATMLAAMALWRGSFGSETEGCLATLPTPLRPRSPLEVCADNFGKAPAAIATV